MMKYFDRISAIDVSPDIRVRDLRIKFEVKKNVTSNMNSARVDIYNLSQNTRNRITSDSSSLVRILAGYSQNTGLIEIGQGNISNVVHTVKSPDIITTIYSKDGFNAISNNPISLSFIDGSPLSAIIDTIIAKLGVPVRYADYNKNVRIKNGLSYVGSIPEILDILGREYKFRWSIQNGLLQILNGLSGTGNQSVFLSPSTGLIESPELVIKTKGLSQLNSNEYRIVSLLQPQLEVGDLVEVDSKLLSGIFIINDLVHVGDTHGPEWYSKMIVVRNG